MRDLHYPNRTIRLADTTWEELKSQRKESGKSWNLFFKMLVKRNTKNSKQDKQ